MIKWYFVSKIVLTLCEKKCSTYWNDKFEIQMNYKSCMYCLQIDSLQSQFFFKLFSISKTFFCQINFFDKVQLKFNSLEILKIPIRNAIIVQDLKLQFSFLLSRSDLHSKLKKVTVMIWRDFYDVSWHHPLESVKLGSTRFLFGKITRMAIEFQSELQLLFKI